MPEFYSKSFLFEAGKTYAIGGGPTGFTGPLFPNGASAMDGVNAVMVQGSAGATASMILYNTSETTSNLFLQPGVVYPFRPKVFVSTRNTYGFL
jgi:hypothetical protein